MRMGRLNRYILQEAILSWLVVTLVLMLLMLGSGFARFLGKAASGKLPQEMVMKLVGLSSIEYFVIILPVSLLLGVMLALGRLYRDNEMAAMASSGVGILRLYRALWPLYFSAVLLTAWLAMELSPWASAQVNSLRSQGKQEAVDLQAFAVGQFRPILSGKGVFYTEGMIPEKGQFTNVFVQVQTEQSSIAIVAKRGRQEIEPESRSRLLILEDGKRYEGQWGREGFRITSFDEHGVRLTPGEPKRQALSDEKNFAGLLASNQPKDWIELNWRLALPLAALILGLLAVPLSEVEPRKGRYSRLVLALVIYMIYTNLQTFGRVMVEDGDVPVSVGIWSIHLLLFLTLATIVARREGFKHRFGWVATE